MLENYLETLFGGYGEERERTIELRALRPAWADSPSPSRIVGREWFPLNNRRQVAEYARAWSQRSLEVYVGVLPRTGRIGTHDGIRVAKTLWVDIDGGEGTPEDALHLLKQAIRAGKVPIPCLITCSGGGLHTYWTLPSAVPITTQEERSAYKALLKRIAEAIGGTAPAPHADPACADIARILRPAGTLNHKRRGEPRPVELLHCEEQASLTYDQWQALHPSPPPAPRRRDPIDARDLNGYAGLWQWANEPYREGTRHNGLVSAACWLLREVCVPVEVAFSLLQQKAQVSTGQHPISEEEIRRILQWAQ